MQKRVICLLSIFLIGALFLGSIGCIKEPKKEKMKTLPAGWKWYENETLGIRMGYPEKWEVEPYSHNSNVIIDFKYFTSYSPETPDVVFSIDCKKVMRDFDLEAYLKEGIYWPPDEIKDVKIDGIPGKQLKEFTETEIQARYETLVFTYVVSNEKLFEFYFVEEDIGKTGYQILDSVEFL
jgi:hypothetical protein